MRSGLIVLIIAAFSSFELSAQYYLSHSEVLSTQGYAYTKKVDKEGHRLIYMNQLNYGSNRTYVNTFHMRDVDGEVVCVAQEMMVHQEFFRDYINFYKKNLEVIDFLTYRDNINGVIIELSEPDRKGYFRVLLKKENQTKQLASLR